MQTIRDLSPVISSVFRWGFEHKWQKADSNQSPVEILEAIADEPSLYIRTAKLLQWREYILTNEEPDMIRAYEDEVEWKHGRPLLPSTEENPLGILVLPEDTENFSRYLNVLANDTISKAFDNQLEQTEAEEIAAELSQYLEGTIETRINHFHHNRSQVIAALKTFRDDILTKHAFFEMDREFIEMDFLKEVILDLKAAFDAAVESGSDKPLLNLALTGESGSGKSASVAFVAVAFHRLGMLPSNTLVRVSLSEISDTTHGGKEKALQEKFDEAEGGTLLFDETDTVASYMHVGQDRSQISQTINYQAGLKKDRSIVVATYPGSMDTFLDSDKGLRSRFRVVHFPERYTEHYVEILAKKLSNMGLDLSDRSLKHEIWTHFHEIRDNLGKEPVNGRTVEKFANTLHGIVLRRVRNAGEDLATMIDEGHVIAIEHNDVIATIKREQAPQPEPVDVYKEKSPYQGKEDLGEQVVSDGAQIVSHPRFSGQKPGAHGPE